MTGAHTENFSPEIFRPPASATTEIAIIGAGVIGLTIVKVLVEQGHDVTVIDPNPPGSGASYGNAGTIADYAVMPVGTPDVLRALPSLLFNRNSPLSIRHATLPTLAPWLLRFARQSLPAAAMRNAHVLAGLLADATPLWRDLVADLDVQHLTRHTGCLYLYDTPSAYRAAHADMTMRRSMGVLVDLLSPEDLHQLEPTLPPMAGAAFFPGAMTLTDPGKVMDALAAHLAVQHITAHVTALDRTPQGIRLTGPNITAKRVIIAAGAHSRALARMAGDRIPLDTERGYHAEWDMDPALIRPACPTSRGFYLCPMQGRLRAAGTVELGGLTAPPSPHRIAKLIDGARAIFPHLPEPDRTWMGFRPSLPDSLPVIGPSSSGPDIIHAFGHGHIGLTLAPLTARIVASLIAGATPPIDIAPLRASRF
jgi:D-hydroxyproline dehydrogenase